MRHRHPLIVELTEGNLFHQFRHVSPTGRKNGGGPDRSAQSRGDRGEPSSCFSCIAVQRK
jgi:hypothetical protein